MGFCGRDETSFIIGISGPQRCPASSNTRRAPESVREFRLLAGWVSLGTIRTVFGGKRELSSERMSATISGVFPKWGLPDRGMSAEPSDYVSGFRGAGGGDGHGALHG